MKKFLLIGIIIFIAFGCVTVSSGYTAFAVRSPYAVVGDDVWLLSENGTKIFLLPKTYYARIDRMDDNYYYVTFNGVSGKISKTSVSVVGYEKDVKETQRIIRVAAEYSVFTEIKLRMSLDGEDVGTAKVPTTEPFTYLGTYIQGDKTWYYVSYGGEYGYILNTYTDMPSIVVEDFVPEEEPRVESVEDTPVETKKKDPDLVKILVISGVSAAALILVIILFIPKKNKKKRYYYS